MPIDSTSFIINRLHLSLKTLNVVNYLTLIGILFHASAPEKLKEHLNISRCTVDNSTSKTEFCEYECLGICAQANLGKNRRYEITYM